MTATTKKGLREEVEKMLISTFGELKANMSPKKFDKNVKKAVKKLLAGLKYAPKKTAADKKASAGEAADI